MIGAHRSGSSQIQDVLGELSYYSLYDEAERDRWKMSDIPWNDIDRSQVDEGLIALARGAAYGELTTFSATRAFMTLFEDDIDVTQWLAVWLYEETKHPHVFAKWLSCVGQPLTGQFFLDGRRIEPMSDSKVEAITFSFIAEVLAGTNYLRTAKIMPEPVLQMILQNCGKDEMRHAKGFEHYLKVLIERAEDPARERIRCMRTAWAFMQRDVVIEHPVFISDRKVQTIADADLIKRTRQRVRTMVARRISGIVGIDIPTPDSIYEVYCQMKADYQRKKRNAS